MTKTTLILPEQTEPKLEFPLLAKAIKTQAVVRFTSEAEGVCLLDNYGNPNMHILSNPIPVTEKEVWTILPRGTKIVIEQI